MRRVNVIGSGVAGMFAALNAAAAGAQVRLVFPGASIAASPGATQLAQGGIAAAIDPADTAAAHARDTVAAGAGLVAPEAAEFLTRRGAGAVLALLEAGYPADRLPGGGVDLALEAAHGVPRIVHAWGDRSGAALHEFLSHLVAESQQIEQFPGHQLRELVVGEGHADASSRGSAATRAQAHVRGVRVSAAGAGSTQGAEPTQELLADATILATGGFSGIFSRSTSSGVCTGVGVAAAARAGAWLADMEFVQFHPTVLEGKNMLISEAVRGAGGLLVDDHGKRFMPQIDPRAELAPRDVVAAGINRTMVEQHTRVWLDARHIQGLAEEFPGITAMLASQGIDWRTQLVPVAPAAHYCMGGIATDLHGRTSVPGLYAAGETARTGVHGANRLASNSLLEAMVFGVAAGRDAATQPAGALKDPDLFRPTGLNEAIAAGRVLGVHLPAQPTRDEEAAGAAHTGQAAHTEEPTLKRVQAACDAGLNVERTGEGIEETHRQLSELTATSGATQAHPDPGTPQAEVGLMVATAARARRESRGAHRRRDCPTTDPAQAASTFLQVHTTQA